MSYQPNSQNVRPSRAQLEALDYYGQEDSMEYQPSFEYEKPPTHTGAVAYVQETKPAGAKAGDHPQPTVPEVPVEKLTADLQELGFKCQGLNNEQIRKLHGGVVGGKHQLGKELEEARKLKTVKSAEILDPTGGPLAAGVGLGKVVRATLEPVSEHYTSTVVELIVPPSYPNEAPKVSGTKFVFSQYQGDKRRLPNELAERMLLAFLDVQLNNVHNNYSDTRLVLAAVQFVDLLVKDTREQLAGAVQRNASGSTEEGFLDTYIIQNSELAELWCELFGEGTAVEVRESKLLVVEMSDKRKEELRRQRDKVEQVSEQERERKQSARVEHRERMRQIRRRKLEEEHVRLGMRFPTSDIFGKLSDAALFNFTTLSHNEPGLVVPPAIGKVSSLTEINFSGCGLSQLPQEISKLHLRKITMRNNKFETIPDCLLTVQMRGLEVLDFSSNRMQRVPDAINALTKLRILSLEYNEIRILPPLDKLTKLEVLELTDNNLQAVPPEIGSMDKLWMLRLHANPVIQIPPDVYMQGIEHVKVFLRELSPRTMVVPPSTLAQDMSVLWAEKHFADVVFYYGDPEWDDDFAPSLSTETEELLMWAHAGVLKCRCPNLYALVKAHGRAAPGSECDATEVRVVAMRSLRDMPVVPKEHFEAFCMYAYTANVDIVVGAYHQSPVSTGSSESTGEEAVDVTDRFVALELLAKHFIFDELSALCAQARLDMSQVTITEPSKILAKATRVLYDDAETSDVAITPEIPNARFNAHRGFLAVRLPYFQHLFTSGMRESNDLVIPLIDVNAEVCDTLLFYLYNDSVGKKMTPSNVIQLLFAASHFQCERLRAMAECLVGFNIDVDNCCQVLQVAYFLDLARLKKASMYFIGQNFQAVKNSPDWATVMEEELVKELMENLRGWNLV